MTTLLWFGRDLRLADNPALAAAIARGRPIVPIFILDDEDAGDWKPGGASRWWLHGSLEALRADLRARGSDLILRRGRAQAVLAGLIAETGANAVYWNRRYEPWAIARTEPLKAALTAQGIEARSFNAALLREPWTIKTQTGGPYRVFTPFWRALRAMGAEAPGPDAPRRIAGPEAPPSSERLEDWLLWSSSPDWAGGLRAQWTPGEAGGRARLEAFAASRVFDYGGRRNLPGVDGTSRLSPHLHFGEISPRQIWAAVTAEAMAQTGEPAPAGVDVFLSEIAWREFSYHLLFHNPALPTQALQPAFEAMPWSDSRKALRAWRRGRTGYPIVDAGMRELWATGWMHNRVRMIAASFLIKHLMIDWRIGEAWFWDTLVDADLASNSASWQWVAGCGADAAPYFRVFNPVLQGEKFDSDGAYVRRWVPEIARLPNAVLHAPWTAKPHELRDAGVELGRTYPRPIVDHAAARQRALAAYDEIRKGGD